ncbi:MAG TPA: hypothetical protein VGF17_03915 [Phytomonospora sp.]|nr:terminase [Dermatophilaceae bacterium]
MTKPGTAPSVVPGARYAVPPAAIASTAWPRVEKTCANIGWRFDPWQRATGRLILSKRAGGGWASDLSILSIPRQVGKSYLLGCIIFALCLLTPKLRVIWTSHHTATTEEMYEAMRELAAHKRVAPHVLKCSALQGSRWRIIFRNGSRIDFGARERGFGRGKAKVGVLVLDEFQHISMRALSNLTPTTNTAENPLILCAGTPPSEHDNGEAFTMRRKAAIDGISTDTLYVEFSADEDADLDDRKQWAKANPSFPARTPERAFLLNRKILDDDNFRREFLGIWDMDNVGWVVFSSSAWGSASRPPRKLGGLPSLAVAASPDLAWASIGAARLRHGNVWGKVLAHGPGVDWLVRECLKVQTRFGTPVILDKGGPCSSLIQPLEDAGVNLSLIGGPDLCDAAAWLYRAVEQESTFRDASSPQLAAVLTEAARSVVWRKVGDRRAFGRDSADITALEAVSMAGADALANDYDVMDSVQ